MPALATAVTTINTDDKTLLLESEAPDLESAVIESKESELIEESEPKESEPRITSSTLWVDYNTYAVGGDGHTIKLMQKILMQEIQHIKRFLTS